MFKRILNWFRRPKICAGNVYYVKLRASGESFYKIGFTTKSSLNERFAYSGQGDEKLIEREFFFTYREDAWDVEQSLLGHFDKYRAFGKYSNDSSMPLAGRGQSELFRNDVLGLDEALYLLPVGLVEEIAIRNEKAKDGCLMMLIGLVLAPFTLGFSLFFLLGGASEFSNTERNYGSIPKRPEHPLQLKELINALNHQEKMA